MEYFLTDLSNRAENQKRNQPAIEKWSFGFVFGVKLDLRQTKAFIITDPYFLQWKQSVRESNF